MNKYGFHARRKDVMRYFMPQERVSRRMIAPTPMIKNNISIDWRVFFTWAGGLGFVGAYVGGGDFGIPFCLGIASTLLIWVMNGEKR